MALRDNLVSWWELNETSGTRVDAHGANDLADINTVGFSASGKQGNAADFESTNSEALSIADGSQSGLDFSSAVSFQAWINMESLAADNFVFSKGDVNTGTRDVAFWWFVTAGGVIELRVSDNGTLNASHNATWQSASGVITTGSWYHVVITINMTTGAAVLYINGSSVTFTKSGTVGTTLRNSTDMFILGARESNGSYTSTFDGLMDEAAVWSRVLTSGEVTELYNSGAGLDYAGTSSATNVTVSPSAQVVTASLPTRTIKTGRMIPVSAQVATFSLPSRTVSLPKLVTPAAQVATFSIPTYVIDAGGNITVAVGVQTLTASIPAYSVLYDKVVSVNAQVATFSTPASTISGGTGVTITPAAQIATLSIPTYTVATAFSLVISAAAQVLTFSIPTLAKVGGVWTKVARATSATWSRRSVNDD